MEIAELKVKGKPEHHDKQIWHIVTGRLDYAIDNLPGKKLFARVLGSPHAYTNTNADANADAQLSPRS